MRRLSASAHGTDVTVSRPTLMTLCAPRAHAGDGRGAASAMSQLCVSCRVDTRAGTARSIRTPKPHAAPSLTARTDFSQREYPSPRGHRPARKEGGASSSRERRALDEVTGGPAGGGEWQQPAPEGGCGSRRWRGEREGVTARGKRRTGRARRSRGAPGVSGAAADRHSTVGPAVAPLERERAVSRMRSAASARRHAERAAQGDGRSRREIGRHRSLSSRLEALEPPRNRPWRHGEGLPGPLLPRPSRYPRWRFRTSANDWTVPPTEPNGAL